MVFVYWCLPISRANSCENVLESHPCGCICTSNCASLSSKSVLSGSCGSCGSLQTYHWPESCHILPMFLFCCQFRISCSGMFSFSTSLESFLGSLSFFDLPRRQWQKMFQPHEFAESVSETKLLSSSSFAVVSCHESSTLKVSEWGHIKRTKWPKRKRPVAPLPLVPEHHVPEVSALDVKNCDVFWLQFK